jgi:DNA-binding NtrC family response regulator
MAARILVLDDDPIACEFLQEALERAGYSVAAYTSVEAVPPTELEGVDLVISDIRMPGTDGLALLRSVRQRRPDLPVILVTAYGSLETTMEAFRAGAWDYISKPFSPEAIRAAVRRVLEVRELRRRHIRWEAQVAEGEEPRLVGSSAAMVELYKTLVRLADAGVSVLIEGESGTGKELVARALHRLSHRRMAPFVVVHCGAIPESLLESELFGYEKGAFTGAEHTHVGLIESAQGGTLFLDEVTEMSPALQGKLLRFLQDGEVRRLGSATVRRVQVRVVAATNRDIDAEVRTGRFRADLLYRFVVRLRVPPLRERKEDLPLLVQHFLQRLGHPHVRLSSEAMECLMAYDWPGNVRELENVLQHALLMSSLDVILPEHLPEKLRPAAQGAGPPLLTPLERAERDQILQTLRATGWNRSRTARLLGIDRKTLRMKMRRYGLLSPGSADTSGPDTATGQ